MNQAQYPSISNISCQNLHQLALVDGIKELFQVHIHRPHFASVQIFSAFLESVVGTSFRSETITRFCEFRFVDWRQHLRNCLLDDTVYCCWDSQFSCLTVVLGYFYPSDGLRLVFSSQNGLSDFLQQSACLSVGIGGVVLGYPLVNKRFCFLFVFRTIPPQTAIATAMFCAFFSLGIGSFPPLWVGGD